MYLNKIMICKESNESWTTVFLIFDSLLFFKMNSEKQVI